MAGISPSRPEVKYRDQEYGNSISQLRFPDKPFPHSILLVFKRYSYDGYGQDGATGSFNSLLRAARDSTGRSSGLGLRSASSIELPFPKQLVDNTSLRMNGFERDILTEQIAQRINGYLEGGSGSTVSDIPGIIQSMGAGMSSMLTDSTNGSLNAMLKKALGASVADVASAAQYLLRKSLPGDIQKSINTATGQAINPRETMAFEGVNLRTHQFNWDLFPSNMADSERIREIVNVIKRNSLPETVSLGTISKAFLRYPSTVDMYLIGVNREYYMKFKTSMVTSFGVDYGAGGTLSIMKGGKPAGVNISMQLSELEIETAHDYGAVGNDVMAPVSLVRTTTQTGNQQ